MRVEEELRGKRVVVVGVLMDSHGRELLNWAITKVAEPGDHVIAIHVCKNSGNNVYVNLFGTLAPMPCTLLLKS